MMRNVDSGRIFPGKRFWYLFGEPCDYFWASVSLLCGAGLFFGLEWLVWCIMTPLIVFAVRGSLRGLIFLGSVVTGTTGILWIGWLRLYNDRTFVLAMVFWYVFFFTFLMGTRLLTREKNRSFRAALDDGGGEVGGGARKVRTDVLVLAPPTVWFLLAKAGSFTDIGTFWTDLAMFQPMTAPLIWLVGSRGITFLIMLANSLIAAWILQRKKKVLMTGISLGLLLGGCYLYSSLAEPAGRVVRVALCQGNFPQSWEWRRENSSTIILETYLEMTREALDDEPDVIVWPEYAILDDLSKDSEQMRRITQSIQGSTAHLVLGTLAELGDTIDGEFARHDIAMVVSPDPADSVGRYISVDPLPFESWTLPGPRLHTLAIGDVSAGVLLCWEETIPRVAAELSKQGASLLISLSNNGRFRRTKGVYLTSLQTRLRAAENATFLARSTNTGITQVINHCGKVVSRAEPFSREILSTEVRLSERTTPYTRFGDTAMVVLIIAAWGVLLISSRRRAA